MPRSHKASHKRKRRPLSRSIGSKLRIPRNLEEYNTRSERFRSTWEKVIRVVTEMRRDKVSLTKASASAGVTVETVKRWAGSTLQKGSGGKWKVNKSDRLLRVLMVPTRDGAQEIAVRGSRQATLLGNYWNALHRYFEIGDRSRLNKFRGKYVLDAKGIRLPLLTDPAELKRLGSAGALSFESLYARSL